MIIVQYLLALASGGLVALLLALLVGLRLIWPVIALLTLATLWTRGPVIAERLGDGLAPRFVTVYDSSLFYYTTGKWEVGENGLWSKVKPKK